MNASAKKAEELQPTSVGAAQTTGPTQDQENEQNSQTEMIENADGDPTLDELVEEFERLPLEDDQEQTQVEQTSSQTASAPSASEPIYDDPSDEDDDQGGWITPGNVALHKSQALDLLPDPANVRTGKVGKNKNKKTPQDDRVDVGCMTADYAMQNVLLHMGLNLVGVEGKKITSVKNWVLRCHACFK
jgi:RNA-binding protein NOB1